MVHEKCKSNAASKLLQKEINSHFVNPFTNKIDLKTLVKHLYEKDEFEIHELKIDMLDDSDFSENQLIMTVDFDNHSEESGKFILTPKKAKRKRKVKARHTSI